LELKTPGSKFKKLMLEIRNPLLKIKPPAKGFETMGLWKQKRIYPMLGAFRLQAPGNKRRSIPC
jgi:hypothetical protein